MQPIRSESHAADIPTPAHISPPSEENIWRGKTPPRRPQSCWRNRPLTVLSSCERFSRFMKKNLYNGLKPIPESKMSPEALVASQAHKRATRKKRAELRRRGLPMIIWKDGKVREIQA
jgi:hypothetical protein